MLQCYSTRDIRFPSLEDIRRCACGSTQIIIQYSTRERATKFARAHGRRVRALVPLHFTLHYYILLHWVINVIFVVDNCWTFVFVFHDVIQIRRVEKKFLQTILKFDWSCWKISLVKVLSRFKFLNSKLFLFEFKLNFIINLKTEIHSNQWYDWIFITYITFQFLVGLKSCVAARSLKFF